MSEAEFRALPRDEKLLWLYRAVAALAKDLQRVKDTHDNNALKFEDRIVKLEQVGS